MYKLDYVWLDGFEVKNLRMKSRYYNNYEINIKNLPSWGFDGSSTKQAEGNNSDCILKPVKVYKNPVDELGMSYIVLCEVMNPDDTPHESNTRAKLVHMLEQQNIDKNDLLFGIEQEYVIFDAATNRPCGWPTDGFPSPQGRYYCGVGGDVVRQRTLIDIHGEMCVRAGISIEGTNAEVMLSQWEYQIGICNAMDVCDDLWIARFILERLAEEQGLYIKLDPKPIEGDWNGSGAHINFSSEFMRTNANIEDINMICQIIGNYKDEMLPFYGKYNNQRLTGFHETAHINDYSWGVSDRSASIRIPMTTANNGRGHLEDRRPAANIDPYEAICALAKTIKIAEETFNQKVLDESHLVI
jgi:glutamine synthetase